MRDHLLVQEYGLNDAQRVRLVTDDDGHRLRGGAADIDALLALLDSLVGLDQLPGWADLRAHRNPSKCKGVTTSWWGRRVTKLDISQSNLSGG
jgi:hypothetical protein